MNIFIGVRDIKDQDAAIQLIRWPAELPLVIPSVGDKTKHFPGPYGIVKGRSFSYSGGDLTIGTG